MFVHLTTFTSSPVFDYLEKYIAVGPVGTLNYIHDKFLTWLANTNVQILFYLLGIQEVFPGNEWIISGPGRILCFYDSTLCADFLEWGLAMDEKVDNESRMDVVAGHFPSGTSTKNLVHFKQLIDSKKFQDYDYGKIKNLEIYGTE